MTASSTVRARAVIVAAGSGERMGGAVRKALLELDGRTILELSCEAFGKCASVEEIVVVAHPEDVARVEELRAARPGFAKVAAVIPGGKERIDSVRIGVEHPPHDLDVVAIHDAARPLIETRTIDRAIHTAAAEGAALVAVPVRDTVKGSEDDGRHAHRTLDRDGLWLAQTPQCFEYARFLILLASAVQGGIHPTDDAALWERHMGPIPLVEGDPANFKITVPADLAIARALLAERAGRSTP